MLRTVLALAAALGWNGLAHATTAADTVRHFHEVLVDTMNRSAKLGCAGRIARLGPMIDDSFDLRFIAERVLRRHWKTLDEVQRELFVQALRSSVITTYASNFSTPGSVSFSMGSSATLANGDVVVHADLIPAGDQAVGLDYQLRLGGENWRVVNVLAEGVSDLALRASQYDGVMKGEGLPTLLRRLDSQTQELRARCS